MAGLKFTGVTYDYNNVTINIPVDIVGASKIGTSGVTIGSAADYDRIVNLVPTVCKVKDDVSSVANYGCPYIGVSAIRMSIKNTSADTKNYTLKKVGNKLNCKVTS